MTQGAKTMRARTLTTDPPHLASRPVSQARPTGLAPAGGWRLSGRPALYLLASLIVTLLAASAAPTPLYVIYQARWGFTPITTTIVFGVYAVAVLASLLTLGKLSDHIGRRPVLLAAITVQAAALLVFTTARYLNC